MQKLTSFAFGGRQYSYNRGVSGLKGLPSFLSRLLTIHFDPLIKKKQAITYIDETKLQSQNKNEMLTVINQYHILLRKVKPLGHDRTLEGIEPIAKRVKKLKNLKSTQTKRDVMKVLGCPSFFGSQIRNLRVESQRFLRFEQ